MHISYHPVWAGDPYLWAEAEDPAVELLAHIDMHSGLGMALARLMDRDIPSEMIDEDAAHGVCKLDMDDGWLSMEHAKGGFRVLG